MAFFSLCVRSIFFIEYLAGERDKNPYLEEKVEVGGNGVEEMLVCID